MQKFNSFIILKNNPIRTDIYIRKRQKKDIFDQTTLLKFKKLRKVYQKVPKTECGRCGECCWRYRVSPIYSIEYLNILKYIRDEFSPDEMYKLDALARINLYRAQKYENKKIKKPKKWRRCIFLDENDKLCSIYECRPLVCRVWGIIKDKKNRKDICSNVKVVNKKDRKLFTPDLEKSLYKELRELSTNYVYITKNKKDVLLTKGQDINDWFLAK